MDIYNIKNYLKYDNQKIAMMQAMKHRISKKKFLEMKKNAGITNWTKEKRKYKKELFLVQEKYNNIIMVEEIEEIRTPYNIWIDIN